MKLSIEADEEVYRYESPENGSGPMWCKGSTCIVDCAGRVFAGGMETLNGVPPMNNCRWTLWTRDHSGWKRVRADEVHRTREPSPLAGFPDGRLFLSVNPTLVDDPHVPAGPARPEILQFDSRAPEHEPTVLLPEWDGRPEFSEHSYRSFAADGPNHELILFQNVGYAHAEWAFLNRDGEWAHSGRLTWPWEDAYDTPQPVRVCYPTVQIQDRAVHFCGVSDIHEPYKKWGDFKRNITGRDWDYDFRRLFYTWSPDITSSRFKDWIEISSRDDTCGWITPGDLHIAEDGTVHIVWSERAIDERLRETFFPDERQSHSIGYAVLRDGEVLERRNLVETREGESGEIPACPRFHVTPDNRMYVVYFVSTGDADTWVENRGAENRIVRLAPDGSTGRAVRLPLSAPLTDFFTATVRGGSPPSFTLHMLGTPPGETVIRHAGVRVEDGAAAG